MGSVAVKINFLTHSMAQGKKQEPLTRDGIPAPSSNIQEAVIQGFTVRGKDVVSPLYLLQFLCDSLQRYCNYLCVLNVDHNPVSQTGLETMPLLPFTDLRLEGYH